MLAPFRRSFGYLLCRAGLMLRSAVEMGCLQLRCSAAGSRWDCKAPKASEASEASVADVQPCCEVPQVCQGILDTTGCAGYE